MFESYHGLKFIFNPSLSLPSLRTSLLRAGPLVGAETCLSRREEFFRVLEGIRTG